jgi:hypothetical protein
VQTARLNGDTPLTLNAASARNLRFLDREGEIIYPWTREPVGKFDRSNKKERVIWAAS